MTLKLIQDYINHFFAGANIDEHSMLMLAVGTIIGGLLFRGRGGVPHQVRRAVKRYRGRSPQKGI